MIIKQMPADEYRVAPGLNFSSIVHILQSPAHYQANLGTSIEPSRDMILGTIVHGAILEGVNLYERTPETLNGESWSGRKKVCQEYAASVEAKGMFLLTDYEHFRVEGMLQSVRENKLAQAVLATCPDRELSIFTHYRGVPIKARLDAANIEAGRICDLKKCRDASPDGWGKSVAERRYLMQAAWYRAALANATGADAGAAWAWLVVEDSAAAPSQIYRPTDEQLDIGQSMMDKAIDLYRECTEKGDWPAYGDQELTFNLPGWARK